MALWLAGRLGDQRLRLTLLMSERYDKAPSWSSRGRVARHRTIAGFARPDLHRVARDPRDRLAGALEHACEREEGMRHVAVVTMGYRHARGVELRDIGEALVERGSCPAVTTIAGGATEVRRS